jgi:hypothetical protein
MSKKKGMMGLNKQSATVINERTNSEIYTVKILSYKTLLQIKEPFFLLHNPSINRTAKLSTTFAQKYKYWHQADV